jgi:hypothetical protein
VPAPAAVAVWRVAPLGMDDALRVVAAAPDRDTLTLILSDELSRSTVRKRVLRALELRGVIV